MPGLSFRVRDGAGRFPWAMTATRLYSLIILLFYCVVGWGPVSGRGGCLLEVGWCSI